MMIRNYNVSQMGWGKVDPVNSAPVATSQNVTTDEGTSKSITLIASDSDGDALTYTIVNDPAKGTLSGTAPNLSYAPKDGVSGSDSFTFRVNDGTADSNIATVNMTINAATSVNNAPIATGQNVTTNEGASKWITLVASDSDGDALTYSIVGGPANGILSGSAPNVTYIPVDGFSGSDSFTFSVNDGTIDSNIATVNVTVIAAPSNDPPEADDGALDSNVASVSITVNINPNAPIANSQIVTMSENSATSITLTGSLINGGFSGIFGRPSRGSALRYTVISNPAHGILSGTAPNPTYTPNANFSGSDSFTFMVRDGNRNSNIATVSITVNRASHVNNAPAASGQDVTTNLNTTKSITLSASDTDGDSLSYSIVDNPSHGILSGTAPNLIYSPDADYSGSDSVTFKANDGVLDSDVATISIVVNNNPNAPAANTQTVIVGGNTDISITLSGSSKNEGFSGLFRRRRGTSAWSYTVVTGPAHGTLSGTAPNLVYTPNPGYGGNDSFTFIVSDNNGNSNIAIVKLASEPA